MYIPLPNFLHREWVLAAVAAGKHVLCEKPLAITADEAQEMVDAARAAGVLLAEAFMYGHHPRYDRLHEIVRSGEIGEVRSISGNVHVRRQRRARPHALRGPPGQRRDLRRRLLRAARRPDDCSAPSRWR